MRSVRTPLQRAAGDRPATGPRRRAATAAAAGRSTDGAVGAAEGTSQRARRLGCECAGAADDR
jgi:hypothetical protein